MFVVLLYKGIPCGLIVYAFAKRAWATRTMKIFYVNSLFCNYIWLSNENIALERIYTNM